MLFKVATTITIVEFLTLAAALFYAGFSSQNGGSFTPLNAIQVWLGANILAGIAAVLLRKPSPRNTQ
jgi:uncharacterized membrane protein YGL010W